MLGFIEKLRKEWHVIKAAPWNFSFVCLIAFLACMAGFRWYYGNKLLDSDSDIAHWKNDSEYWKGIAERPKQATPIAEASTTPSPSPTLPKHSHIAVLPKLTPAPPQQVINAAGGIPITGGNVNNPTVINNGPPPANLTLTEEVVTPLSASGEKLMKIHVRTDRPIRGAIIGLVLSGAFEMSKGSGPDEPSLTGSGASQINWGGLQRDGSPLPNSVGISINIPSVFTPGEELIVPVRSKSDVHVVQAAPVN